MKSRWLIGLATYMALIALPGSSKAQEKLSVLEAQLVPAAARKQLHQTLPRNLTKIRELTPEPDSEIPLRLFAETSPDGLNRYIFDLEPEMLNRSQLAALEAGFIFWVNIRKDQYSVYWLEKPSRENLLPEKGAPLRRPGLPRPRIFGPSCWTARGEFNVWDFDLDVLATSTWTSITWIYDTASNCITSWKVPKGICTGIGGWTAQTCNTFNHGHGNSSGAAQTNGSFANNPGFMTTDAYVQIVGTSAITTGSFSFLFFDHEVIGWARTTKVPCGF